MHKTSNLCYKYSMEFIDIFRAFEVAFDYCNAGGQGKAEAVAHRILNSFNGIELGNALQENRKCNFTRNSCASFLAKKKLTISSGVA